MEATVRRFCQPTVALDVCVLLMQHGELQRLREHILRDPWRRDMMYTLHDLWRHRCYLTSGASEWSSVRPDEPTLAEPNVSLIIHRRTCLRGSKSSRQAFRLPLIVNHECSSVKVSVETPIGGRCQEEERRRALSLLLLFNSQCATATAFTTAEVVSRCIWNDALRI